MADDVDVLICYPAGEGIPLKMPDNKIGICDTCGGTIQYRPVNPTALRRLCLDCGMFELNGRAAAGEPVEIAITEETQRLLKALMAAQRDEH